MKDIWQKLEEVHFRVSTDTRKSLTNSLFIGLKGENFNGNDYIEEALKQGASGALTDRQDLEGQEGVYVVPDTLKALQDLAGRYRKTFQIPVVVIGGSNGKTTTKELTRSVLATKYKVFSSEGNLNNHIGVPLSILSMSQDTELGVFEIGANHHGEHTELLHILTPTHVAVTNSGLDHLEGFGSQEGVERANNEILEWARENGAEIVERQDFGLKSISPLPLTLEKDGQVYKTNLFGSYNLENINLALSFSQVFGVDMTRALEAISSFVPKGKRSEIVELGGATLIVDCYNANPSSMKLALEDLGRVPEKPKGVILGDMLELGTYAESEHKKIVEMVGEMELNTRVFIGTLFQEVLKTTSYEHKWFPDAVSAGTWFHTQDWHDYTLLLKGSRGKTLEKVFQKV